MWSSSAQEEHGILKSADLNENDISYVLHVEIQFVLSNNLVSRVVCVQLHSLLFLFR